MITKKYLFTIVITIVIILYFSKCKRKSRSVFFDQFFILSPNLDLSSKWRQNSWNGKLLEKWSSLFYLKENSWRHPSKGLLCSVMVSSLCMALSISYWSHNSMIVAKFLVKALKEIFPPPSAPNKLQYVK